MSNKFVGVNYFGDDAQMDVPSEYFLQRIYDYDAMLVLFPSRARPGTFVLARRRQYTAGLTDAALASLVNPDTKTCVMMGWVPVCVMFKTGGTWNPDPIIQKLKARDLWAAGGADKAADALEAQEADAEAKRKAELRDDMYNRSGDAWRSYQHRTGQTTIHSREDYPTKGFTGKEQTRTEAADSTASTPRSTAGLDGNTPVTIGGEV